MRASVLSLALAALVSASDVTDLKKDTFKDFIKQHDIVLAEFFAPWCGHCKALAPEYELAATELKPENIQLVKVDCTEETELCQEYGVEGYPTLKVFRGLDTIAPYTQARKQGAIVDYMRKQVLPAVSILNDATYEKFLTDYEVALVAYFAADDKSSNETFSKVADALRDNYVFGATSDAGLAKAAGVSQPSIVLYKKFDEGKNTFSETFDLEAIKKFAKTSATPLIGEVGPETYQGYMEAGIPLAYIFAETAEERKELAAELKAIAEEHKGKINFATIDAKSFGQHGSNLNLEVGKWPAFAIQDTTKNTKFPFDQAQKITGDSIAKFISDFTGGKIEPSIKSEAVPESQDGPVHVIVATTYQKDVIDNKKDVLVEFYAPWCGHCKALAPKYDELAGLFKDSADKVVIAKVDATANDVPDDIQGFPTIKLFPADKKDAPITYTGSRTVEDLAKFVQDSGTHKVAPAKGAEAAADSSDEAKPSAGSTESKDEHDEL